MSPDVWTRSAESSTYLGLGSTASKFTSGYPRRNGKWAKERSRDGSPKHILERGRDHTQRRLGASPATHPPSTTIHIHISGETKRPTRMVVGMTGATEAAYAIRMLAILRQLRVETRLAPSNWAMATLQYETFISEAERLVLP
ncbi:hypothetical protein ABOM_003986 [Aspergillus bombycis]|uniref:Flavoprotein domain-containing protein n=1 Tax=Aspergillus bombycis TaxID=109264 RepID=A0A1F8A791_9EURO|nr:hypothetical protein ABOM_003986 [Aspergillus bombycis]OGM47225.1 hypothetical protein ABOM_003986 [Aspergillus bombycis]